MKMGKKILWGFVLVLSLLAALISLGGEPWAALTCQSAAIVLMLTLMN